MALTVITPPATLPITTSEVRQYLQLDAGNQEPVPDVPTATLQASTPGNVDNGAHRYVIRMIGNGVSATPNRLIRVSMRDASDHQTLYVCGLAAGCITNPPLIDLQRKIVIGYDSANRHLQAWRFDPASSSHHH